MLFEEEYRAECWTFLGFGDPRLDGVQDYKLHSQGGGGGEEGHTHEMLNHDLLVPRPQIRLSNRHSYLPSANSHRRALTPQLLSPRLGLVWMEGEKRTVNVKSANPILVSPPLLIEATLTSAKNSGKLLKPTTLNAARLSFSSSPVPTFPPVPELVAVAVVFESSLQNFLLPPLQPSKRLERRQR
ncbi:hypothetical protein PILCRDRAFT_5229 [Piloderma croceum F 1598]|uniref:Uncharacterized protein n=1 Tax=Piloderma croceum (strain F 1598) TaxID=765440 RepID=A0A0C3G4E5_PILCF|nr:hypothetical protein PILCRDRAFT_5229 [Piloderma croceum F 1598]